MSPLALKVASRCLSYRFSMRLSARLFAFTVVLLGLGFAGWSLAVRSPYSPWYVARWEVVGKNLQRLEFVSSDDINVLVYALDPKAFDFSIAAQAEPQRVAAWSSQLVGERVVINGFYFLEDQTSAGLLITQGQALHAQEFDLDKSGVIRLAPEFDILDTGLEHFSKTGVTEAGQSYPFLLKQGGESIQEDSGLLARRTFIGTDEAGQVYVGVVWKDDVSLFELMQILQELDVNWYDVINLDGGPSTGIAVETGSFVEILDSAGPVPNVIVIQPK